MEFDATFFALALPAALIAGVAKGGFGGGAAFVATAILALFLPPATALGIMLPLLMIADLATLRPFWGEWHWPIPPHIFLKLTSSLAYLRKKKKYKTWCLYLKYRQGF